MLMFGLVDLIWLFWDWLFTWVVYDVTFLVFDLILLLFICTLLCFVLGNSVVCSALLWWLVVCLGLLTG